MWWLSIIVFPLLFKNTPILYIKLSGKQYIFLELLQLQSCSYSLLLKVFYVQMRVTKKTDAIYFAVKLSTNKKQTHC